MWIVGGAEVIRTSSWRGRRCARAGTRWRLRFFVGCRVRDAARHQRSENKAECRAATRPVLRPNRAALAFDDRSRDRQAESDAVSLGAEERLEDVAERIRG